MHIGIDASNIRVGGGLTHLVELLRAADPGEHDISRITVWGSSKTIREIADRPWLDKVHEQLLDRALPLRQYWQRFVLQKLARRKGCSLLFFPGGSYAGSFRPFVALSQNMLPFEGSEAARFGLSLVRLRIALLRLSQTKAFMAAEGVIFLTDYAAGRITGKVSLNKNIAIIPHGINGNFIAPPRSQKDIDSYSRSEPFQILYVSIVDVYKHQWRVAEAVATLAKRGFPVRLSLIGPAYAPALKKLRECMARVDRDGAVIRYLGPMPYEDLPAVYASSDLFVYASSCENMPNILLEAMASGLPIACSNCGPMPEVLRDAGLYFDPESPAQIAATVEKLLIDRERRLECAARGYEYAKEYSWKRCAHDTFSFLARVALNQPGGV
jgi:glycosyltransferase involved in cell wall biosynthesis